MSSRQEKMDTFNNAGISKYYSQYRPAYPNVLLENIINFLGQKLSQPYTLAVDVACGTGQGTRLLADHFPHVLGIDISSTQIAEAKAAEKLPNVSYQVGAGEKLPCEANSVDLVTIGSAIHWLEDLEVFYSEVDRVLKRGGCLAVYSYTVLDINLCFQDKTESITQLYKEVVLGPSKSHWNTSLFHAGLFKYLFTHYQDLPLPYGDNLRVDNMKIVDDMTVADLMGYTNSLSRFAKSSNSSDRYIVLQELQERIMSILDVSTTPDKTFLKRALPLFLCMSRKPDQIEEAASCSK